MSLSSPSHPPRPKWLLPVAIMAIVFGVATLFSGGGVLFVDGEGRRAAGHYVSFVVWFNFLAGFFYIVAGAGLLAHKSWAARLAFAIGVATVLLFVAFGLHVAMGGAFERRTVAALALRATVWLATGFAACRALGCSKTRSLSSPGAP